MSAMNWASRRPLDGDAAMCDSIRHLLHQRSMICVALALQLVGAFSCASGPAAGPQAKVSNAVVTSDRLPLPAPGEGYSWAKVRELNEGQIHARVYLATKPGAEGKAVLVLGFPAPKEAQGRFEMAAGFLDGITSSMIDQGYTAIQADRSTLKYPVPDRVPFRITATTPSGKPSVTIPVIVFGKNQTFEFQSQAPTEQEAKALAACLDRLKEQP
jgi:hypothetical protein